MSEISSIGRGSFARSEASRGEPRSVSTGVERDARAGAQSTQVRRGRDRVELSSAAPGRAAETRTAAGTERLTQKDQPMPRAELIETIRSQISAGTYLSDEKIDAAIDKFLEGFAK